MNFRNRYLVIAIRILLGLIMLASGISGLLMGNSTQGVPAKMVAFTQVFWASGIFQMVKVTEIVAGFMLLVGIFPALATLFLAPDVVGIVIVNARLMPSFLWLGAVVLVLTAYLGGTPTGTGTNQFSPAIDRGKADHWDELFCSRSWCCRVVVVPSVSPLIPATAGRSQLLVSRLL
ncbi:MAG: hypothetical protein WAM13_00655 [Candidatus Sulfotelmatobacter sp.]